MDSTNSADGAAALRDPTMLAGGLTFQLQPRSEKLPMTRARVSNPYQKKMPPLMKCASPLSTWIPFYILVLEAGTFVAPSRSTYKVTTIRHYPRGKCYESEEEDQAIGDIVRYAYHAEETG